MMAEVSAAETGGNMAVSPGGPGDHAACDAEIARLRAKLAAIADHCRLRMNAPGRSGMTMAAAGLILGIAEGSSEEEPGNG